MAPLSQKQKDLKVFKPLVCVLVLLCSLPLQAQNSKVEVDLFGLGCLPLQEISHYSFNFNVFGSVAWDSYQVMEFKKNSLRFGLGARFSYWFDKYFGFRLEALSWSKKQKTVNNSVYINYSYTPSYPEIADEPVDVSYKAISDRAPELSYRINALSLNGIYRNKFGVVSLDVYGGLTAFHSSGALKNLYFYRTVLSSRSTFQSDETLFDSRFDFMSLGGNFGIDLSIPMAGDLFALFGLKYFFAGTQEPRMFIPSLSDPDETLNTVAIEGIDEIAERSRHGFLEVGPTTFAVNLGLGYSPQINISPVDKQHAYSLMLFPGISNMSLDTGYERTFSIFEDGSGQSAQSLNLFDEQPVLFLGIGGSYDLTDLWSVELRYLRQRKDVSVDSGPVVLYLDQDWKQYSTYQRPQGRIKLDEFCVSIGHKFPVLDAEFFMLAGLNLARIVLKVSDLYFLFNKSPLTSDFVSFTGLYSADGSSWVLGANVGAGFQFPIIGTLKGRLSGSYSIYKNTSVVVSVDDIELGDVWGYGEYALEPEELQPHVSHDVAFFNPSRFKIYFALIYGF